MATAGHNRPGATDPKTDRDWHVQLVYSDPEFIETVELIAQAEKGGEVRPADLEAMKQEVADYFLIGIGDVNLYMLPLYLENRKKSTAASFNPKTRRFTISFNASTTKAEMLEEWEQFEHLRKTLFPAAKSTAKRKPSEQPQLLYAVFKALKQHTGVEVFELYKTGRLPGFNGRAVYDTSDELLHYYNTHKRTAQDV